MDTMFFVLLELLGFVIVVAVLWWKVVPVVRELMRKQQDEIRQQVEASKQATQRLQQAEVKYREVLAEAHNEAARIRDNARLDADRIVEEMRQHAEAETARIKQRGEEQLVLQRTQMVRQLRGETGADALRKARQLVGEHLADPANRSATVDRFLDDLEGMSGSLSETSAEGGA